MPAAIDLPGLDGANPLGFLAALGVLAVLDTAPAAGPKLGWRFGRRWVPSLVDAPAPDAEELARILETRLRGETVPAGACAAQAQARNEMDKAQKAIEDKRKELKRRRLRGQELRKIQELELRPLELVYEECRRRWLDTLRGAVPSPELSLGKRIDCSGREYRALAGGLLANPGRLEMEALHLLAAFGSDACSRKDSEVIEATPFSFINGSGHQNFLETAGQLMTKTSRENMRRTLFERWDYRDEGHSMRWDPSEDRRYALMDRDPTAAGNKASTMWMANLLAYRALAAFPSAPAGRRLLTAGWDEERRNFTWPLWAHPASLDLVRSLVQSRDLIEEIPDCRLLKEQGILAAYRAHRIQVGTGVMQKLNFAPPRRVA